MKNEIINTSLIPQKIIFNGIEDELDLESICVFVSTGFFLGDTTYFKGLKTLLPGKRYDFDTNGKILKCETLKTWNYKPIVRDFSDIIDEYISLLNHEVAKSTSVNERIILPLSGGLDSRSLAAALGEYSDVFSYSYSFQNGIDENKFGMQIAKVNNYDFKEFVIPNGYLWGMLKDLSEINDCYSEFTHPRQMAIYENFASMGDTFLLGHWGDVLFDNYSLGNSKYSDEQQVNFIRSKILKKGGLELAEILWKEWDLSGSFINHLNGLLSKYLSEIKIDNLDAKFRAFKSLHWATRWTTTGIKIFESTGKNLNLPYFSDNLCEFIMGIEENHLKSRKIQIEGIKKLNSKLAEIPWQNFEPFNLINYNDYFKIENKIGRKLQSLIRKINHNKMTSRNWELQFLGQDNLNNIEKIVINNNSIIPIELKNSILEDFKLKTDPYTYHQLSMLITLETKLKFEKDL